MSLMLVLGAVTAMNAEKVEIWQGLYMDTQLFDLGNNIRNGNYPSHYLQSKKEELSNFITRHVNVAQCCKEGNPTPLTKPQIQDLQKGGATYLKKGDVKKVRDCIQKHQLFRDPNNIIVFINQQFPQPSIMAGVKLFAKNAPQLSKNNVNLDSKKENIVYNSRFNFGDLHLNIICDIINPLPYS